VKGRRGRKPGNLCFLSIAMNSHGRSHEYQLCTQEPARGAETRDNGGVSSQQTGQMSWHTAIEYTEHDAYDVISEEGVAGADGACPLTVTHFSPFGWVVAPSALSVSSSEVMLSSVSASTPVLVSDSELLEVEDSLVASGVKAGVGGVEVDAAGVVSVGVAESVEESSLFDAAASARSFLALAARSFLSSFC